MNSSKVPELQQIANPVFEVSDVEIETLSIKIQNPNLRAYVMNTSKRISILVETTLATTVLGVLLASCGGGGGNSGGGSGGTANTTTVTVIPYKGKYSNGTVSVTDANGINVPLLNNTGSVGSDGNASVTYSNDAKYPLIFGVSGTYQNELTGASEVSATQLRAIVPVVPTAVSGVPAVGITAISELGVESLLNSMGGNPSLSNPIDPLSAAIALGSAASLLGSSPIPIFDSNGSTVDRNTIKLAALSVVANSTQPGTTLVDKTVNLVKSLASLPSGIPPTSVISQASMDTAIAAVNGGTNSVLPSILPTSTVLAVSSVVPTAPLNTYVPPATSANTSNVLHKLTLNKLGTGAGGFGMAMANGYWETEIGGFLGYTLPNLKVICGVGSCSGSGLISDGLYIGLDDQLMGFNDGTVISVTGDCSSLPCELRMTSDKSVTVTMTGPFSGYYNGWYNGTMTDALGVVTQLIDVPYKFNITADDVNIVYVVDGGGTFTPTNDTYPPFTAHFAKSSATCTYTGDFSDPGAYSGSTYFRHVNASPLYAPWPTEGHAVIGLGAFSCTYPDGSHSSGSWDAYRGGPATSTQTPGFDFPPAPGNPFAGTTWSGTENIVIPSRLGGGTISCSLAITIDSNSVVLWTESSCTATSGVGTYYPVTNLPIGTVNSNGITSVVSG